MTGWGAYEPYRLSGLWHVHTDVTDGANSPREILEFAAENNFPLVGFTEHLRADPTYDFATFYDRTKELSEGFDLECVVGCEVKVLNEDGELDATEADLARADVVYAAYHGTPFEKPAYVESVYAMLERPVVDVWAHPFTYATREGFDLEDRQIRRILEHATDHDVLVEQNLRYDLPEGVSTPLREYRGIVGYDIHDLENW